MDSDDSMEHEAQKPPAGLEHEQAHGGDEDLDEKYPNRPHNHSPTPPFHTLFETLFNPLSAIKKQPASTTAKPAVNRRKLGPHGGSSSTTLNPFERRRDVIERFISHWRQTVGDDIYPAFRLILPDKDRDRAMYGLKEKAIGKMFVKILKIDKNSEDAVGLLNWKLPGGPHEARFAAGDFARRCYDVISKRPMRTEVGSMLIEEVNERLDRLSAAGREGEQLGILQEFYRRMNPEELLWLIRIILRQMKVGASERTLFDVWHPDAEGLYSISSSLRRVCWELHDPNVRLEDERRGIALMQCFQPQLAQFQMQSLEKMVGRMRGAVDGDDAESAFWIEEKLDGERMQLHMGPDNEVEGGRRFRFWSRKAKDYTYLYGNGLFDENGALTRHLADAFADGVESVILDGEMIAWSPEQDAPEPFGTLKSAAIAEQRNPFANGSRPLFRVFDILYLNGHDLTRYTLRDRRNALQRSIEDVHRRFEVHPYEEATSTAEVEAALRRVVAEASEGLVLKNPRAPYRLNERHDDWMKVKPEYMTEFGESLDLIVIGGYYGSGRRGGALSSFLCGLRVDESSAASSSQPAEPSKCYSFCKVGGGFTAADYANIRHHTDGKWKEWNPKKPPLAYIELAGAGNAQHERPDMWIKPEDSVVLCVKAASVSVSDQFRIGLTLRFPRFKRLRGDKDWRSALSVQEFLDLKSNVEQEQKEKAFDVENFRKKRQKKSTKKPLAIAGYEADAEVKYAGPSGHIFDGLNFFVMTDSTTSVKKTKAELEQLVKSHGGKFYQTNTAAPDTICVADRRTVKAASLQKTGEVDIIRPSWILDCIRQSEIDAGLPDLLLPLEPRHMFFTTPEKEAEVAASVDRFGDSYARDTTREELSEILQRMETSDSADRPHDSKAYAKLKAHLYDKINAGWPLPCGWLFDGLVFYLPQWQPTIAGSPKTDESEEIEQPPPEEQQQQQRRLHLVRNTARFAGARVVDTAQDPAITHVIVQGDDGMGRAAYKSLRAQWADRAKIPHFVTTVWVDASWREQTLLDEESVYDPNSDHRRKGVYKKDADTLRTKNATLLTLIQALLNYEEEDAFDLVRQIRSCDNLEDVAQSILGQQDKLPLAPDSTGISGDEADQFESELSGKMSELMLDGSRKFIGGTSNLIFLPPGSELNEFNVNANHRGPDKGTEVSVSQWTRVTDDEKLISHLMTMYFTWHYPFFTTLSKDLFYRDYLRGISSQYCSSLLVNTMLALGCHFTSWGGAREDPANPATAGDHFFREAKRLFFENDEHANAKLCTVQALALMSVREAGCGRESKGWVYSGMSFRMASDLGLNFDSTSLGVRSLSEEEIDARRITFWGCFLFDKCWSNYLGRQPQWTIESVGVSMPEILPNEEAAPWTSFTDAGASGDQSQPSRTRAIAVQIAKLCEINGDLLVFFYDPKPKDKPSSKQSELKKLSEIHTRLETWKKNLPKELGPQDGQLPQALLMHMLYQLLLIHLYRPFLKYTKSTSPLPQHVSPRKLCTQAASAISKLLRMYKRAYGFKQICNVAVYMAHTALTVHLLNLPEKNAQRDVVHGLRHLEEMGESWLCARRTLRILEISANKWHVELPPEAVTTFEQTHVRWGSWGSWDQALSPPASEDSPPTISMSYPESYARGVGPPMPPRHAAMGGHSGNAMHTTPATTVGSIGSQLLPDLPVPVSASAMRAVQRSLNTQLAQETTRLPEPTYLRPVAHAYAPYRNVPLSQAEVWYNDDNMRAFTTVPENSPATTTSPANEYGGSENLVEESQDWWSRESHRFSFGMDNWVPDWNPGMANRASNANPSSSYPLNVGQTTAPESAPHPPQTPRFAAGAPGAPSGTTNADQPPTIPSFSSMPTTETYRRP
ncbi:putative C6 transcription factor (NirA) [Aspergillus saccharolyticus JOP 1030-1]|uniref:DNA ligase n=1 Tax=Aspergillus saccharolyticus JOP 1030-1 TaxID=1450539 RepID=A0A318ZB21_9EURO|nr:ATP-dependent DNA ligase [Aspergillus saccharolyticus JOP 1030-1]PYH44556.1 ATP-dependent DNA ligase [Aspergillus saccharolyticus JOP 1030-1]